MGTAKGDDPGRSTNAASDRSLLDRFRTGEQDAATKLYERYAARLQALVSSQTAADLKSRFDAEDVVQSVFRTLFRRVAHGLYDVPAGEELWQLLLVLALNKTRKLATHHRAQKRDVGKTHGSAGLELAPPSHDGRDEAALRILELVVDDLLSELPETHRRIIKLRIEGYRTDDISQTTQRSKRTVERVLQDFRQQLSALIDARPSQPSPGRSAVAVRPR
jgi:RNA polymerase sigma-70 factor (ECF subfamily)